MTFWVQSIAMFLIQILLLVLDFVLLTLWRHLTAAKTNVNSGFHFAFSADLIPKMDGENNWKSY